MGASHAPNDNRYGEEVGRLTQALSVVKKGHDLARKSSVTEAVRQDIKVCAVFSELFSISVLKLYSASVAPRHGAVHAEDLGAGQ